MSYTIHNRVKVLSVEQQNVERRRRPQEIADPTRRRDDYTVTVARFTDVGYAATISDFAQYIQPGQLVSVAINDKQDVIAVRNFTTNQSAGLKWSSMKFSDIWGILFFMAVPLAVCGGIAWKMWNGQSYHDKAWIPCVIGLAIAVAILRGMNKDFNDSKKALAELK